MSQFRTRVGAVHIKGGAELRVLHSDVDSDRSVVAARVRSALEAVGPDGCKGYAFVVWDDQGAAIVSFGAQPSSCVPTILIPDFVRNLLLANRIETWTIETVNASWGNPTS